MKQTNNKTYIILLIFALACLFLAVFCIAPLFKGIEKNSKDLISAKNDIVLLDEENAKMDNFKKNYDSYKPNLDKIDQMFIDPAYPVEFIKFLEGTASKNQITSKISLQEGQDQPDQGFIIFQFSSAGSFSDMLGFSKDIESGPYLIEIENLTIQNLTDEKDKNASIDYSFRKVSATFTIKVFTKK